MGPHASKEGQHSLASTASKFAVCDGGDLIGFVEFRHVSRKKSPFPKFGPTPISTSLPTESMESDEVPTDIRTRMVTSQKNDAVSRRSSRRVAFRVF